MDRRQYLERIAAATSVAVGLAGCGAPGDDGADPAVSPGADGTESPADGAPAETETTDGTPTGADGATNEVAMITEGSDYLFDPVGLYVEPGETITWINESGGHSSTAYTEDNPQSEVSRIPEEAEGWNSETLTEEGAEFTHTFEVEGTYDYYCIPHKTLGMVGRIVVGEPSGLEGDPPDGPVPGEQRIVDEGAVSQAEFDP